MFCWLQVSQKPTQIGFYHCDHFWQNNQPQNIIEAMQNPYGKKNYITLTKVIKWRWLTSMGKDAPCSMSLRNCKLKQWDVTTPLSEWPKFRTMITPNVGEDMEQQQFSFIAHENARWYSHSGKQLGRTFGSFLQN